MLIIPALDDLFIDPESIDPESDCVLDLMRAWRSECRASNARAGVATIKLFYAYVPDINSRYT